MKANLFALFCITLFVLSVPQAFAEDTNSAVTTPQTVEETPTEAVATEADPSPVEEQQDVEPEPTKLETKTQEPAPVKKSANEEGATEESGAAANTETNKTHDGADKVPTVESADETKSDRKTAPVSTETGAGEEQDSTEQVASNKSDDVVAPSGEENTTEENAAVTDAELKQTPEAHKNETTETPAVPTEAPGSTNATNAANATNATNAEPSAPVSSPEENQEAAPAAEESQETAPAAESEEQLEKKDGLSLFGLISKVLVGLGLLSVVILVGCVYHYRYQMQKYKIAPFTPPSFLPECLFPRNTESSGRLISGYTELQVGNYQSAPRFAEI